MRKKVPTLQSAWSLGQTLLLSPFTGAIAEMKRALNRPRPRTLKEWCCNAMLDYFAPLIGAIKGIISAVRPIRFGCNEK